MSVTKSGQPKITLRPLRLGKDSKSQDEVVVDDAAGAAGAADGDGITGGEAAYGGEAEDECAELDRLRRFCIAYEYVQAEKIRDSAVDDVEQVKAKIAEIDENTERTRLKILEMEKQVSNLTAEKEASMAGEVKILSDKVDKLSQGLVLEVSVLNNKDDNLRSEKGNAKKIVRNIEDLKQSIEEKASAVRRSEEGAADLKKRVEEISKSLGEYEKDYQEDHGLGRDLFVDLPGVTERFDPTQQGVQSLLCEF
ncbi:hypothetical protein LWI29_025408 [Acer saccharum]|uniref:Uncharacterized protein n=1 Tax=Acer saccharum TaxID=4024 RepID=A0AA39VY61_ACESA|nr:hypothetical protein LWI29_025408 [Acer saccharum]